MSLLPDKSPKSNPKGEINCLGVLAYFVIIIGEIFLGLPLVKWVMVDLLGIAKTDNKGGMFGSYTWQVILVWALLDQILRWLYSHYLKK